LQINFYKLDCGSHLSAEKGFFVCRATLIKHPGIPLYYFTMLYLRHVLFATLIISGISAVRAQNTDLRELDWKLTHATSDTVKAFALDSLSMYYFFYSDRQDSAFYYINKSINNAFTLKDKRFLILAYARLGFYYLNTAQINAGLTICFKGIQLAEQYNINDYTATLYYDISFLYYSLGDSALSMENAQKSVQAFGDNKDPFYDIPLHVYGHISNIYADGHRIDSALYYLNLTSVAEKSSKELAAEVISEYYWIYYYLDLGDFHKTDSVIALGIASCIKYHHSLLKGFYEFRAASYFSQGRYLETIASAKLGMDMRDQQDRADLLDFLQASYYKTGKIDSAYHYLNISDSIRGIVKNQSNINETQQLQFESQLNKKEASANLVLQNEKNRNRIIRYIFIMAVVFFLLFGIVQWRNNRQKRRANGLLFQEKQKVESTLSELRSTQRLLVQSEKMASLGELTAGIAHEIQNPLNFVNNFSELSTELLDEMNDRLNSGDIEEAKAISKDIRQNLEKINHHGKRADAIVKGMLQHSRTESGKTEPTDINALCAEYLHLSYHGLRAKDQSLNATLKTDFDESIQKINIIAPEIGRVLLNLFNNALYAVNEKLKRAGGSYEPVVSVRTKKTGNNVFIVVTDNGSGIEQKVIEKIFQPFFTTKPPGEGTGLGLSISYDVIKAHGGVISANSTAGEGSEFVIQLPA
jgi:two-component system, NtrC family, sensor kinase